MEKFNQLYEDFLAKSILGADLSVLKPVAKEIFSEFAHLIPFCDDPDNHYLLTESVAVTGRTINEKGGLVEECIESDDVRETLERFNFSFIAQARSVVCAFNTRNGEPIMAMHIIEGGSVIHSYGLLMNGDVVEADKETGSTLAIQAEEGKAVEIRQQIKAKFQEQGIAPYPQFRAALRM